MKCVGRSAFVALSAAQIAQVAGNLAPQTCHRGDAAGSCSPLVHKDSSLMQLHHARFSTTANEESAATCCDECSGKAFCSPNSGNCYDSKAKNYYESCGIEPGSPSPNEESAAKCCGECSGRAFCSPNSGNCYDSKAKNYYESCGIETGSPSPNEESAATCCGECSGRAFCSPNSGNCYDSNAKNYYESCGIETGSPSPAQPVAACCHGCEQGRPGFCSPNSGMCYESKAKDYYESCPDGGTATPERRLQSVTTSEGSIKFMSYNLFGWNAFNTNKWKSDNILNKIRAWGPDVFGAQEVETGGGQGSDRVSEQVTSESGLSGGAAIGQFFNSTVVEAHETENFALVRGYWMSMTRFTYRGSNVSFLFFNSHWKHGYGKEQKHIIANAVHEQRMKYGSPPTILVGDTNQFCQAHELEAITYLTSDSSPVPFVDAIAQDKGMSYDGGCRVDFILASVGQWKLVKSSIDREGMGGSGSASDHAALMAELVPIVGEASLES